MSVNQQLFRAAVAEVFRLYGYTVVDTEHMQCNGVPFRRHEDISNIPDGAYANAVQVHNVVQKFLHPLYKTIEFNGARKIEKNVIRLSLFPNQAESTCSLVVAFHIVLPTLSDAHMLQWVEDVKMDIEVLFTEESQEQHYRTCQEQIQKLRARQAAIEKEISFLSLAVGEQKSRFFAD